MKQEERIEGSIIYDRCKNDSRREIAYKVISTLGVGGFGKVFQVSRYRYDNTDGKEKEFTYALKIIPKQMLIDDKALRHRIITEIKLHRQLNHKYICRFEHSFNDEKNVNILLEFCEKKSLNDLLASRKSLTEKEVRHYMYQTLEALIYLHRQKIVHRDLTLNNLFLTSKYDIKVGDFGLSFKETNEEDKKDKACGTEPYLAPEVMGNLITYTHKIDIWAFGIDTYELLTGEKLFSTPEEAKSKLDTIHTYINNKDFSDQAKDLLNKIFTNEQNRCDLTTMYEHSFFHNITMLPFTGGADENVHKNDLEIFKYLIMTYDRLPVKKNKDKDKSKEKIILNPIPIPNPTFAVLNQNLEKEIIEEKPVENIKSKASKKSNSDKKPTFHGLQKDKPIEVISDFKLNQNSITSLTPNTGNFTQNSMNCQKDLLHQTLEDSKHLDLYETIVFRYVDVTKKYGIGYILLNGMYGAYFNDGHKMVCDKDNLYHWNNNRITPYKNYPLPLQDNNDNNENDNDDVKIKYQILKCFIKALYQDGNKNIFLNNNNDQTEKVVCVSKWKKTEHAMCFLLSNKNIQANFFDRTRLIFFYKKKIIRYYSNENEFQEFSGEDLNQVKCNDKQIKLKIAYLKKIFLEGKDKKNDKQNDKENFKENDKEKEMDKSKEE